MNTGFGSSNSMFVSALAVVAIILGGTGLYFGLSARNLETQINNRTANLEQRVETVVQDNERIGGQVRSLEVQTQRALTVIASQVEALSAKLVKPTNAVPERVTSGGARTPSEPTGPGGVHVIKSGETLAVVAKKYGVSVSALTKANPSVDSKRLKIGQKIKIPGRSGTPAPAPAAAAPAAPAPAGE